VVAAPAVAPAQAARALLKQLQEQFPVFRDCLPLAIGIDKQVLAQLPDLNRKALRIALGIHTNSLRYLKTMEKAAARFDLEGKQADEVTDAHRAHATQTLQERIKKNAEFHKERRKAEEAQRKSEEAQRKAAEAEAQRSEKLNQLAAKFSKRG
jgi:ProP effector